MCERDIFLFFFLADQQKNIESKVKITQNQACILQNQVSNEVDKL
jgi:hypothetical protein